MNGLKASLSQNSNDNTTIQRRRFPRRANDVCMVNVEGHPYPVVDWSMCGILFEADSRPFTEGSTINMILRFKTENSIEDVKITGNIVRKNSKYIATQFHNLPSLTQQSLHKIIDNSPEINNSFDIQQS